MRREVTKAIFPVAGMGTRFLPATKSVPKEIMTLVDRPLIQYAIDEARAAGIKEFIFVTSRGKGALEDYFDHAPQLEQELRKKGKNELLELLKKTNMDSGAIAYIRQHKALGLGWSFPAFGERVGVWKVQDREKLKTLDPRGAVGRLLTVAPWRNGVCSILLQNGPIPEIPNMSKSSDFQCFPNGTP